MTAKQKKNLELILCSATNYHRLVNGNFGLSGMYLAKVVHIILGAPFTSTFFMNHILPILGDGMWHTFYCYQTEQQVWGYRIVKGEPMNMRVFPGRSTGNQARLNRIIDCIDDGRFDAGNNGRVTGGEAAEKRMRMFITGLCQNDPNMQKIMENQ